MGDSTDKARQEFATLPGIKQSALAELGACRVCGKKMLEAASPTFYRVKVERAMWNRAAIQRAVGLELMIGALAPVMGPDDDFAKVFEGFEAVVHEHCAGLLHHLLELSPPKRKDGE